MLRVRLFGEMAVEVDGSPVAPPESARARALLAWLALNPGMHSRGRLAARFWPDVLDSSARASLRSAMWSLRRALGDSAIARLTDLLTWHRGAPADPPPASKARWRDNRGAGPAREAPCRNCR